MAHGSASRRTDTMNLRGFLVFQVFLPMEILSGTVFIGMATASCPIIQYCGAPHLGMSFGISLATDITVLRTFSTSPPCLLVSLSTPPCLPAPMPLFSRLYALCSTLLANTPQKCRIVSSTGKNSNPIAFLIFSFEYS